MSLATEFTRFHHEHIRLAVLRVLDQAPGYSANDSVLHQAMNALGLVCSRDQMRGELAWLAQQLMVSTVEAGIGLTIATLTERGADVAAGRSVFPGIQRPSPKG